MEKGTEDTKTMITTIEIAMEGKGINQVNTLKLTNLMNLHLKNNQVS